MYLIDRGYKIRRKFMVWCQGETDGDNNMSDTEYKIKLQRMIEMIFTNGLEKCFLIRIGNHRDAPTRYSKVIRAQTDFCKVNNNVILVSTKFDEMAALGLMKDPFHYKQSAYNTVGEEAGKNTAFYIKTNDKPICGINKSVDL